jgi:hypothetical protein
MSLQTFHLTPGGHIQETTVEEQFKSRNLKLFDSIAQKYDRDEFLQQSTHPNTKTNQALSGDQKMKTQADLAATAAPHGQRKQNESLYEERITMNRHTRSR